MPQITSGMGIPAILPVQLSTSWILDEAQEALSSKLQTKVVQACVMS